MALRAVVFLAVLRLVVANAASYLIVAANLTAL